ncbi:MAG: exo-alpha-sialidase [Clostridia bacterium]|nr:exo-alpha-sialidase [Clostridia bacterium]
MRLLTSPEALRAYGDAYRLWQGIPGVEVTPGGRIFVTFYSGGKAEAFGNFCLLLESRDEGASFSPPIAVIENGASSRAFDPCLWLDPRGRLWWTFNLQPEGETWAYICDDPDGEHLVFSGPRRIGGEVMMNKPLVTRSGDWLFPVAVWPKGLRSPWESAADDTGPFVYRSRDGGESFQRLGCPRVADRSYDEHMLLEKKDGTLVMYSRTKYGIAKAESSDGGVHWSEGKDSGIPGPSSRFFIRALPSGAWLLINHVDFTRRNNLAALLSFDEGETWQGPLMLDERPSVSYPDAALMPDGSVLAVYDRERGCFKNTEREALSSAREILACRFRPEDVPTGVPGPGSFLRRTVNKLTVYEGPDLFCEKD